LLPTIRTGFFMRPIRLLCLLIALAALPGCITAGVPPVQGLQPSAPAAMPTPADLLAPLKGGLVAGPLGTGLTERAKTLAVAAEYRALETGLGQPPIVWRDERSRIGGEVKAGTPYRVGQQDCRNYTHVVTVGADMRTAAGSACRQPQGAWLRLD
jgi:surface antigen